MPLNKQHFIEKFSAIPDELWITGQFTDDGNPDRHCALGFCDPNADILMNECNEEYRALQKLILHRPFGPIIGWPQINDGECPEFQQATPKARVLAALEALP